MHGNRYPLHLPSITNTSVAVCWRTWPLCPLFRLVTSTFQHAFCWGINSSHREMGNPGLLGPYKPWVHDHPLWEFRPSPTPRINLWASSSEAFLDVNDFTNRFVFLYSLIKSAWFFVKRPSQKRNGRKMSPRLVLRQIPPNNRKKHIPQLDQGETPRNAETPPAWLVLTSFLRPACSWKSYNACIQWNHIKPAWPNACSIIISWYLLKTSYWNYYSPSSPSWSRQGYQPTSSFPNVP